jgi:protein TonB
MTFDSFQTSELATRRLRHAVIASLVLHLLILWPATSRLLNKDTPALLQATLRLLPPSPAAAVPAKPPPRAVPPAPTFAQPLPRLQSPVLESPRPASVPPPAAEAAPKSASVVESIPTVGVVAAATSAQAGSVNSPLLTDANAAGETVDGLRGYRLALATQARRFKRYPARATASGWEGTADIRLEVGSDGQPRPATLVRSSGHDALDQAALTMIDAGAQRARLPDSLRGKTFAVVLPVVFNLDD